jgi:hypothetical protein
MGLATEAERDNRGRSLPSQAFRIGRKRVLSQADGVGPGHKLIDAAGGPAVDKLGQHILEPSVGGDAIEFASLDERRQTCPVLGALIVSGEETILAIQHRSTKLESISMRASSRKLYRAAISIRLEEWQSRREWADR